MNTYICERIHELYAKTPQRSLWKDLVHHFMDGFVFSGEDYLLMGERINDGWFVHIAVGEGCLEKFISLMPYHLPWIGWAKEHRGGEVRWYRTESVKRNIKRYEIEKLTSKEQTDSRGGIRGRKTKTAPSTSSSNKTEGRGKCAG